MTEHRRWAFASRAQPTTGVADATGGSQTMRDHLRLTGAARELLFVGCGSGRPPGTLRPGAMGGASKTPPVNVRVIRERFAGGEFEGTTARAVDVEGYGEGRRGARAIDGDTDGPAAVEELRYRNEEEDDDADDDQSDVELAVRPRQRGRPRGRDVRRKGLAGLRSEWRNREGRWPCGLAGRRWERGKPRPTHQADGGSLRI